MYRLLVLLILAFWLVFSDSAMANYRPYSPPDFSRSPNLVPEPKQSENVTVLPTNLGGQPIVKEQPSNNTLPNAIGDSHPCTNPSTATGKDIADRILNNRQLAQRLSPEARQSIPIVIEECAKIGITDNARLAGLLTQIMLESSGRPRVLNEVCRQGSCADGTPTCAEGLIQVIADAASKCAEKRNLWRDLQSIYPDLKNQPYKPRWISDVRNGARIACQYAKKNRWFDGNYSMDELGIIGDKPQLTQTQALKLRQSIYGVANTQEVIASAKELYKYYPIVYKEIVTARKNATTPQCIPNTDGSGIRTPPIESGAPLTDEDADKWCSPHPNSCQTDVFGYLRPWRTWIHNGVDLASSNPGGAVPIYAAKAGKVKIGEDSCGEPLIIIEHPDNKDNVRLTKYIHLRPGSLKVRDGQIVKCGQELALEGGASPRAKKEGCSTGYHLHFEVYCKTKSEQLESIDPECTPALANRKLCLLESGLNARRNIVKKPLCKEASTICGVPMTELGQKLGQNLGQNLSQTTSSVKPTAYNHCYYGDQIPKQEQLKPVGNNQRLISTAAVAYKAMAEAAKREGIKLIPLSGFRDEKQQKQIFDKVNVPPQKRAFSVAPAGYSEHHTGYAIDIGDEDDRSADVNSRFTNTKAFAWLLENARRFNFELSFNQNNCQNIMYEPWHWRYIGDGKMKELVNRCFKAGVGTCKL